MASENETVADIKSEMYGIVADEFGYVKLAQSDFIGIADRSYAARRREVDELCKCLKAAVDDYFKNQCPRCMGCRSTLRCEFRGWQAVLEKYMKSEGGNDGK